MKSVTTLIKAKSKQLRQNALLSRWLVDPSIDAADRLAFVPMALDFIMGFRDFNRYYVMYPEPKGELEAALNAHAREDETHSSLLVQDWASLGLDQRLGWAPRDLYWWMTSDVTAASRRLDFDLTHLVWSNPDPLLRFAIIESMEAAGNVFFAVTVPIADELEARTGKPFPYFGKYHFDRETGHLQNGDERLFYRSAMSEAQRAKAKVLVERVFDVFEAHFTAWEEYARALREGRWRYAPSEDGRGHTALRPEGVRDASVCADLDHPVGLTGRARDLATERAAAYAELWAAPGYRWVRTAFPGDFRAMTRYFLLQWVVDNWACADYFTFDTAYPAPSTPLERGINRLSALYASEMRRRYVEWETLRFDHYTRFSVTEALRHYWLDDQVEQHRAVFAELRKLTFRHPEPLYRYWIMKCFVRFGDTLMRSLGVAMRRSYEQDEGFITFAGHPERLHPALPADPEADQALADVERRSLDDAEVSTIRSIIAETKAQEARRAELTWQIVQEKRYEPMHRRWMDESDRLRGDRAVATFPSVRDQNAGRM
jgi:hypothetical protein